MKYESLSDRITAQILADRQHGRDHAYAFDNQNAQRRKSDHDIATLMRPPFIRDIDKIMHCPYFNRYADKTQVFSFYKNDDLTRRILHVQLVSRIARTIGAALGLNLDLIEAIALGHDIGHTPFGHAGENVLDEIVNKHTGRHFSHNIHSVRVLDGIFPYNITLQTLNGIAAHNGELELCEYRPEALTDFAEFDRQIERCYADKTAIKKLVPCTLEGCVVRISDIIAYLGKDRQDADKAHIADEAVYTDGTIGVINAEIIHNLMTNIIENSYGKPYIKMDAAHFEALKKAKAENYALIYGHPSNVQIRQMLKPMMEAMYDRLLDDLAQHRTDSPLYRHHLRFVREEIHYARDIPYEETEPNQIVIDYIASMTDDYFAELYAYLFPGSRSGIPYHGYFEN